MQRLHSEISFGTDSASQYSMRAGTYIKHHTRIAMRTLTIAWARFGVHRIRIDNNSSSPFVLVCGAIQISAAGQSYARYVVFVIGVNPPITLRFIQAVLKGEQKVKERAPEKSKRRKNWEGT